MPRSSLRHNREIYGKDAAGETPYQHGEIPNDPAGTPGPGPVVPVFDRQYASTLSLGADASFDRGASGGTVVDFEGLVKTVKADGARGNEGRRVENILSRIVQSTEDFTSTGWIQAATVTPGISDPKGGTTASTLAVTAASQTLSTAWHQPIDNGIDCRTSIWIRRRTGSGSVEIASEGITWVDISSEVDSTWKRFTSGINPTINNRYRFAVRFGLSGYAPGDEYDVWHPQGEFISSQSNQNPSEYVSVGVLATPYHGANVDGVKYFTTENGNTVANNIVTEATGPALTGDLGWLMEQAATNDITYSEDLSHADWTKSFSTITANDTTAPDGTITADKLVEDTSTSQHIVRYSYLFSNATTYTISSFLKKAERTKAMLAFGGVSLGKPSFDYRRAEFDLDAGTILFTPTDGSAAIEALGNGWYRCSVTISPDAAGTGNHDIYTLNDAGEFAYTGDGSSGIYAWGHQLEEASIVSSYIKTTGAPVTRPADVLSYPLTTPQSEGMAIARTKELVSVPPNYPGNPGIISFGNIVTNVLYRNSGGTIRCFDDTTLCQAVFTNNANLDMSFATRWAGAAMQTGAVADAAWVWSTECPYDGAFGSDNTLRLLLDPQIPRVLKSVSIYDTDQGQQWIEDNF